MAERNQALEQDGVRDAAPAYHVNAPGIANDKVPPGYKLTEIGVMPEDWKTPRLGSLGDFYKGQGVKRTESASGSIPCVRYGEIYTYHNEIVRRFISHISRKVADNATPLCIGDILFAGSGETKTEIGKAVAFVEEHEAYAGGDIVILRQQSAEPRYLGYVLNAPVSIRQKSSKGQGDAVVHISASALASVKIPLPPSEEQRAIATALSDADALIASLDRLIAKKRAIKQAAMQQLLTGQTRLPGFTGEWETKRLGELSHIKTGNRNNQDKVKDGRYPFFVRSEFIECINSYSYDCEAIIVPGEGRIGDIFHYVNGRFDVHQRVYVITQFHQHISPKFIYHYMVRNFGDWALKNTVKATVDSLRLPTFQNFELLLPSTEEEQTAIATVFSDMDTEIEALDRRREKARQLKQGMMQQLLTGRVRLVNSVEPELPESKHRQDKRRANVHFMRSVFAAEVVDQLHQEPTFGHVKLEKVLFLAEHICDVDTGSTYHRKAAGPYDNRALRSIDSQLQKQQWFAARREGGRYRYVPLDKRGKHKEYFGRYFSHVKEPFQEIVETFRRFDTERCEIVATLFAAWDDILREKETVTDEMIIHEVLNNWHESKKRIPKDRWSNALSWMRKKGFVPERRLLNE